MYVVSHKKIEKEFPKDYKTIIVNASVNKVCGDFYDNTGDNITEKNGSYCELTAMYWIWKNRLDDFVGISHYRRFFLDGTKLLSMEKAKKIVESGKIIIPEKESFNNKIETKYWMTSGYKTDLLVIRDAINIYSPEYIEDYDNFMHQNKMHCYNMIIMNKELYDSYCEWLFGILKIVEENLDSQHKGAEDRRGYYKRVYGFIAERLLNVWIIHNNCSTVSYPVLFTGNKQSLGNKIVTKIGKLKDKYIG